MATRDELLKRAKAKRRLEMLRAQKEPEEEFDLASLGQAPLTAEDYDVDPVQMLKSGAAGLSKSMAKPLYGAMDYAGVDFDTPVRVLDKATRKLALEAMEEEADKSAAGTAAELVGDVAKFALPGTAAAKVLGTGTKLARAGTVGTDVATAVGVGALEGGAGQALEEGLWSVGGLGVAKGLEKAVQGVRKMPGAEKYIREQGGYLTPGQAASSPAIRGLETAAEVTPFLARGTKEFKQEATEQFSESMINKVAKQFDEGADALSGGQAGMRELDDIVESGYDDAWDLVDDSFWNKPTKAKFAKHIKAQKGNWSSDEAAVLTRLAKEVSRDKTPLKRLDRKLRSMVAGQRKNPEFKEVLQEYRTTLRELSGTSDALRKMDASYPAYLAVQDAAAATEKGVFEPKRLVQSVRKIGGKKSAAGGRAPLQQEAEELSAAMAKTGGAPLDFFRRLSGVAPTPIPRGLMKKMGDALIGETDPQRAMQIVLADPAMRNWLRRAGVLSGAVIAGEE